MTQRLVTREVAEQMLALASKKLTLTGRVGDQELVDDLQAVVDRYDDD